MLRAYMTADIRCAERAALEHDRDDALMRRAAAGLAAVCSRVLRARFAKLVGTRAVILVGPGGNGGDGLFAGAELARRGVAVTAVLCSGRSLCAPRSAYRAAGGRLLLLDDPHVEAALSSADLIVDAIYGLGGRGGVDPVLVQAVRHCSPNAVVIAADVPSGMVCDTGELASNPVLQANHTVVFGAYQPCHLLPPAEAVCGQLHLVDLNFFPDSATAAPAITRWETDDVARSWPVPTAADHKYTRGVVGVLAGSGTYPGAAVLACGAAVASGAGMVRYGGDAAGAVLAAHPEVVCAPGRTDAWLLGPGLDSTDTGQRDQVREALATGRPCVVDAGALSLLAETPLVSAQSVLTPHVAELAALHRVTTETILADPAQWAKLTAASLGCVVLLKGAVTVIADRSGRLASQADGPAWLATAGSGDVLAGIIATLLAAGCPAFDAAAMGTYVHGLAGQSASRGGPLSASMLVHHIAPVIRDTLAVAADTTQGDSRRRLRR